MIATVCQSGVATWDGCVHLVPRCATGPAGGAGGSKCKHATRSARLNAEVTQAISVAAAGITDTRRFFIFLTGNPAADFEIEIHKNKF